MSIGRTARTRLLGAPFNSQVSNWQSRRLFVSITPIAVSLAGNASATQTLSPVVNPANCLLLYTGNLNAEADNPATSFTYLSLTNSSTVTATRNTGASGLTATGTLLEFKSGILKSVQRGLKTFGAATSATQAITAVTTANTVLNVPGWLSPNATYSADSDQIDSVLTSSTLITFTRGAAVGALIVSWEVAEFF